MRVMEMPIEVQSQEAPQERSMARPDKPVQEQNLRELWQEYTEQMFMLPDYIRGVTRRMDDMRRNDMPDPVAYKKLKGDLEQVYRRFADINLHVNDEIHRSVEGIEDSYIAAMEADTRWQQARQEASPSGSKRPEGSTLESPEEPLELYNEKIEKLLERVIKVEEAATQSGLDEHMREEQRQHLADIYEELDQLDQLAHPEVTQQSQERKSLIELLKRVNLRLRLPLAEAASTLGGLWVTHQQIRAQYAAVQHTLTDEQRRLIRGKIAQMAVSLKQAEDEAGPLAYAMVQAVTPPPPPPEPPTQTTDIRSAVQLAVSRAAATASAIADAFRLAGPESRNR